VRVSAAWPTGNKAAPYAATVSLTVTNTAAAPAPAPLKVVLTSAGGYADAGNGQAWGWDAFSVTAGAVQGSIMQARPPAQPAAPRRSAAGCRGALGSPAPRTAAQLTVLGRAPRGTPGGLATRGPWPAPGSSRLGAVA